MKKSFYYQVQSFSQLQQQLQLFLLQHWQIAKIIQITVLDHTTLKLILDLETRQKLLQNQLKLHQLHQKNRLHQKNQLHQLHLKNQLQWYKFNNQKVIKKMVFFKKYLLQLHLKNQLQLQLKKTFLQKQSPFCFCQKAFFYILKYFLLFLRAVLIIEFLESKALEYHIVSVTSVI